MERCDCSLSCDFHCECNCHAGDLADLASQPLPALRIHLPSCPLSRHSTAESIQLKRCTCPPVVSDPLAVALRKIASLEQKLREAEGSEQSVRASMESLEHEVAIKLREQIVALQTENQILREANGKLESADWKPMALQAGRAADDLRRLYGAEVAALTARVEVLEYELKEAKKPPRTCKNGHIMGKYDANCSYECLSK